VKTKVLLCKDETKVCVAHIKAGVGGIITEKSRPHLVSSMHSCYQVTASGLIAAGLHF
jgi:hypothetical protein